MGMYGAIAGGIGGLASGIEAQNQGDAWNRLVGQASQNMSAPSVYQYAQMYNPWLFAALNPKGMGVANFGVNGQGGLLPFRTDIRNLTYGTGYNQPNLAAYGATGYSQQLGNIANNPGYIDPTLLNMPFINADRQAQQNMQSTMGMIGRSGAQGGLGSAFALANQAGSNNQKQNIMQQYVLFREQQRRSDLEMINAMINQAMSAGLQARQGQSSLLIQKKPSLGWAGIAANTIKGAMEGAAGTGTGESTTQMTGGFQGKPTGQSSPTSTVFPTGMGSMSGNNITPESNPLGVWGTGGTATEQLNSSRGNSMFPGAPNTGAFTTTANQAPNWGSSMTFGLK